jgi:putative membrane protein
MLLEGNVLVKEEPMPTRDLIPKLRTARATTEGKRPMRWLALVASKAVAGLLLVAGATIARADDVKNPTDFLSSAIQDGRAEIQSCQIALRKSSDASVQAFAKRMITDHKSLDAQIESLAKRKGYSLPSGISITQKATQAALTPLTGHAFDKVFVEHNVSDHKDDIKHFSDEAQHGSDPDVRALAASATPILREHLKLAEETRAKIEK